MKAGRIVAAVKIENLADPEAKIRCDALVDTGASYMVLHGSAPIILPFILGNVRWAIPVTLVYPESKS
jgi:hypothetical protein